MAFLCTSCFYGKVLAFLINNFLFFKEGYFQFRPTLTGVAETNRFKFKYFKSSTGTLLSFR